MSTPPSGMIMDFDAVDPADEPTEEEMEMQAKEDARASVGVHTGDDVTDENVDWSRQPAR